MLVQTCMIKLMELTLAVACLILHLLSYDLTDVPTLMLCSGTYVGYIAVFAGEIIGECLFAPVDLVQDIYFGIVGMALFSASGGKVLSARVKEHPFPRTGDYGAAVVCGCVALLVAVVLLFDVSLAYLDSEEYDEDVSV
ncbi:uncharacterized protein LOC126369155 [Pectinophora gossypiella]|uniref:uncharacterized protein LOC126369155 n=1 Tax=Pectinophora gossypiella TaxID=13191 RepID=UPI00214E9224|nr:uncharacterized protein LOC126369155 [Pectinophora gossypiella]